MIIREKYLDEIRGFYDSDLVKVITGIRRCGKSVILDTIRSEIALKTDNIIYLNFENAATLDRIKDYSGLIEYVGKNRKEGRVYLFLDEIQLLDRWADAVKTLRLTDCSIFVSGSNSKLLSSEVLSMLSGREVSFRIRPFVYKEIAEYCAQLGKTASPADYLVWGGFPKRFEMATGEESLRYLSELEDTIVINDLMGRYRIKNEMLFRKLVSFVFRSNSRIFSSKSVHDYIKNEYLNCSINTIIKYLGYLKEAYVIEEIPQYSTKAKRELIYYGKLYLADVCFNSLHAENNRFDLDHNLENVVYNELIWRGYSVKVYSDGGREIDFMTTKKGKVYYVQAAYSVADEKAYQREMSAFDRIGNTSQKILITTDPVDYSTSAVRHIRFDDFLTSDEL